jgi:putative membrane protein
VVASKRFGAGERHVTEKRLRLMNEVPSLVTLAVAVLVIVKPF